MLEIKTYSKRLTESEENQRRIIRNSMSSYFNNNFTIFSGCTFEDNPNANRIVYVSKELCLECSYGGGIEINIRYIELKKESIKRPIEEIERIVSKGNKIPEEKASLLSFVQ